MNTFIAWQPARRIRWDRLAILAATVLLWASLAGWAVVLFGVGRV